MKNNSRFQTVKKGLLATGYYSIDDLVTMWDCDPEDVRTFIHTSEENGYLFTVQDLDGNLAVPAIFFDKRGCLRIELHALLRPLRKVKMSAWRQWAWLVSPDTANLNGEQPCVALFKKQTKQRAVQAAYKLAVDLHEAHELGAKRSFATV